MQTWKTRSITVFFDNRCVDICGQRNVDEIYGIEKFIWMKIR